MSAWHESVASDLALPGLYDLDDVIEIFDGAGFDVSVARLEVGFVPVSAPLKSHEPPSRTAPPRRRGRPARSAGDFDPRDVLKCVERAGPALHLPVEEG
ncbi:MAG TPA: hypothetical protein VIX41_11840, partial [Acidimicrobiales bacterium]